MLGTAVEQIHLGAPFGSRGSYGTGAARSANRFEGTACPPNERVVSRGSDYRAAAYIGGPTNFPYVYCSPIPAAAPAPPPPPPQITVQTTVSPTMQTQISPQISPVFAQMQDSPGSQQSGAPTQYQPGGMTAEGGGTGDSGAMLEFLRMQSEQEAVRRREDAAARERERQDRLAREAAQLQYDRDRQAQIDAQQLQYQRELQAQQNEMQRIDQERRAAEQAGRDEEAAALQAQYELQQQEWEKTKATPPQLVQTGVMPGRQMLPADGPGEMPAEAGPGLPVPLIVAAVAAVAVGGYFYATKGKKR